MIHYSLLPKCGEPVDLPDDPAQCPARIERWRAAFEEAKDGSDTIGLCSMVQLLVVFR